MYASSFRKHISFVLIVLIVNSIPLGVAIQPDDGSLGGMIGALRGGFGVKAPIDNYQLAWGNRPVTWTIHIEGDFVLFGYSSGTVAAMGKGTARSSLLPPAIGFGAVTVTLTVSSQGAILEEVTRTGVMIGPMIFLGL